MTIKKRKEVKFTLRIDNETYKKFVTRAKLEKRSRNAHIIFLIIDDNKKLPPEETKK
jgi:predicted HicB family RNase H-like nuclease